MKVLSSLPSIAKVIVTCEHGGNQIPAEYQPLFATKADLLNTHRGYDPGSLHLAQKIAEAIGDASFFTTTSRLLVELNRSINNKDLFSEVTKSLPKKTKNEIVDQYYFPYRLGVENAINDLMTHGAVLHLSIHSFTPVMNDEVRNTDVGLLYDPSRCGEKEFCRWWRQQLFVSENRLKVRFNYPYQGRSDGLVTFLRKRYPADRYLGIELEINQKYCQGGVFPLWLERGVLGSLAGCSEFRVLFP